MILNNKAMITQTLQCWNTHKLIGQGSVPSSDGAIYLQFSMKMVLI